MAMVITLGGVLLLIVLCVGVREIHESMEKRRRLREGEEVKWLVRSYARTHLAALVRKYRQTVHDDDYGNEVRDAWERELDYFLETVVGGDEVRRCRGLAGAVVELMVVQELAERAERGEQDEFSETMSPAEFEQFCADELARAGWKARVIGGSGDQGVDVVAEKGGRRVVIQCKKYGSPVGNKAVQEAFAGLQYHAAEIACVVSNGTYTRGAQELAATTGVRLLDYSQLACLDEIIGPGPA